MKKLLLLSLILTSILIGQQKRILEIEDLWAMQRIGSFSLSPDNKTIAFSLSTFSMELNKGNSDIYTINSDGSKLTPILNSEKSESNPKFTPDGKKISYVLGGQLWLCDLDGSSKVQLTDIYSGVSDFVWSNDGSKVLFTSSVYPDCVDDDCNKRKDEALENSKVKASLFTELMYRHWNDWRGDKRSHLFLFDVKSKETIDLTLGSKFDVPPISLGSAKDFSFSPDDKEVAFTMNTDEFLATSTNNDIFIINLADAKKGSKTDYKLISVSKGNDNQPVYSPDGKYIAYCSMERAGFEADKQRLMLYNRTDGTTISLTDDIDLSVAEIVWSSDSKSIIFNAANQVYESVYKIEIATKKLTTLLKEYNNTSIAASSDGKMIYFKQQRTNLPHEIFALSSDGKNLKQITFVNKERLANIEMNDMETFWSKGADDAQVQSVLIRPPFFDAKKKYPMIFLIHGGPQGNWGDDFHYRWNVQAFAAQGYVVVAPNPRGSTGYGQKFCDEISGDWGGKVYTDLMNAYDYAIENFSYIDKENTFAAGASYGGYMINWIAGHTDRFNALVSHAGVFNLESMYGTTEELWFTEWEFKGTPWQNRELYEKFSPHRYIHNCKTPVLVVHGAYDFRVPEEQAFQLFTSLQRLGVPSQFLYFPDETHFVAKPQNARLWWKTVFDWYGKFYKRNLN
ncbi:MAG: S9 family peptidase [Ignavibacteriaceae bacterium]|nr:S9 family peptidase [Ignavibacteriaceae bacterium]